MAKTWLKRAHIETLARVTKPFGPHKGTMCYTGTTTRFVQFFEGRVRVTSGMLGAEFPFPDLREVVLMPVAVLTEVLPSLKSDARLQVRDGQLLVAAGHFKGRFATAELSATPPWPDAPENSAWITMPADAWAAVQSVAFAASKDTYRVHSAVKIDGKLGQAFAVDGPRVARGVAKGLPVDVLLPADFLEACATAFPDAAPDAVVAEAANHVWLRFGDVVVWSYLPAGDFPTTAVWKSVQQMSQEAGRGYSAQWNGDDAVAALKRVVPFAGAEDGMKNGTVGVRAAGKRLVLTTKSRKDLVEEFVDAKVVRPFEVEVDPVLLADAFSRANCCAVPAHAKYLVFRRGEWELLVSAVITKAPKAEAAQAARGGSTLQPTRPQKRLSRRARKP